MKFKNVMSKLKNNENEELNKDEIKTNLNNNTPYTNKFNINQASNDNNDSFGNNKANINQDEDEYVSNAFNFNSKSHYIKSEDNKNNFKKVKTTTVISTDEGDDLTLKNN